MDEKFQTSQQKAGEHHLSEGKKGGEATVDKSVNDGGGRGNLWDKTSQQLRAEISLTEGD